MERKIDNMERKIGDVVTFDGKQLEVIEGDCWNCYFFGKLCFESYVDIRGKWRISGLCSDDRMDKDICYKLIEE